MAEDSLVKCGACRCILVNPLEHGLIDAHSHQLHNTSLPYNGCPSLLDHSRLFIDQENLPEFIHQSVMQTGFTTGRLKCLKCGAKLGAFNFIKASRCSCGEHSLPPVHLTLSKVDYPAASAAQKRVTVSTTEESPSPHSSEESSSEPLLKAWSSEQHAPLVDLPSASNKFVSFFKHQGSTDRDTAPEACGLTYDSSCSNPDESDTGSVHTNSDSRECCTPSAGPDLEGNLIDCSTPTESISGTKRSSSFNHERLPQPYCSSSTGTSSTTSCKYLQLDSDVLTDKSSDSGDWSSLSSVTVNNEHSTTEDKTNVDTLTASGLSDTDVPSVGFVMGPPRSSNASAREKDRGIHSRSPSTSATSDPAISPSMPSQSSSNALNAAPSSTAGHSLQDPSATRDATNRKSINSARSSFGNENSETITNITESANSNSDSAVKPNDNGSSVSNPCNDEINSSNSAVVESESNPTTSHDSTVANAALTPDAELLDYPDHLVCPICLELLFSPFTVKPCGHIFCEPCLRRLARPSPTNTACPLCREIIGACQPAAECTREVRHKYPKQVAERHKFEQNNSAQHLPLPWLQSYRFLNFDSGTRHPRSGVYTRYSNWWRTALWIFWVDAIGFLLILTLNWFLSQTIHGGDPQQRMPSAHHVPAKSNGMPSHILLDGSGDGGLTSSKLKPYPRLGEGTRKDSEWARYGGSGDGEELDQSTKFRGMGASTDYLRYKKLHSPHTVSPIQTTTYAPSMEATSTYRPDDWNANSRTRTRADKEMRVENYERMMQDLYNRIDKFNNPFSDDADVDGGSANYNVISRRQTRSKRRARMRRASAYRNAKFGGDSLGSSRRADDAPRSSREGVRWWLA